MTDLARLVNLVAIAATVIALAWLARFVALDMDRRDRAGWLFGLLVFFFPPVGIMIWLLFRERR